MEKHMAQLTWEDIPDEPITTITIEKEPDQVQAKKTKVQPSVLKLAELTTESMAPKQPGGNKRKTFDEIIQDRINQIRPDEIWSALQRGQDGDADLFVRLFKDIYLYDRGVGGWQYFNDHHWRDDKKGQVLSSIDKVIAIYDAEKKRLTIAEESAMERGMLKEAKGHAIKRGLIIKRLIQLHTVAYKKNVLTLASSGVNSLATTGDDWDSHPMLLAVRNGCIDLETGHFFDGRPDDMLKSVCPTKWADINAIPQAWIDFLHGSLGGDQEIIDYVQRLLGYAITGLTHENIYPILWGEHGQNGKGTLIETVKEILGQDLAVKLASEFLMQRGITKSSGSPDADLYSLRGARVAWCSETNKNERINASKIKELSGSDTISARPPYAKRPIVFRPTHLIFILTNMRPQMPADDQALWLRTHLIQFNHSFVERPNPERPWERKKDHRLSEKLKAEYPAILAWMVRGCLEWQKHGLMPPEKIMAITESYRKSEDIFQDFLDDVLIKVDQTEYVKRKAFFQAYAEWANDNGYKKMNLNHFYKELSKRLGEPDKKTATYKGYAVFYDKNA